MFRHFFKYRIIELFRQKDVLFWNMIFPILLATFMYVAMSGLNDDNLMKTMRVYTDQEMVRTVLEQVDYEDKPLYELIDVPDVEQALKDGKIDAAVTGEEYTIDALEDTMELHVLQGVIVKMIQITKSLELAFTHDQTAIPEEVIQEIINPKPIIQEEIGENKQENMSYYYSILAMAALSSITLGVVNVNDTEPKFSQTAKRLAVSPARRMYAISAYAFASFLFSCLSTGATLAYMHYVLKISFGNHWLAIFALLAVGIALSVIIGMCIGLIPKLDLGSKIGLGIAVYMLFSALGGMMSPGLKHMVRVKVPPLYTFNPSALMIDGIGSLYYFENFNIYYKHLGIMAAMSIVLLIILAIAMRGTRYEHI